MNNKNVIEKTADGKWIFFCPGCKEHHYINDSWEFNNNLEVPTIKPSIKVSMSGKTLCHFFVRNGKIEYLNDCVHELANKTVDMIPLAEV